MIYWPFLRAFTILLGIFKEKLEFILKYYKQMGMKSENFPDRLKNARIKRKMTQCELANKADIIQTSIAHFEIGSRKPSFDNLKRLAVSLNVTSDYLLGINPKSKHKIQLNAGDLTADDIDLVKCFIKLLNKRRKAGK